MEGEEDSARGVKRIREAKGDALEAPVVASPLASSSLMMRRLWDLYDEAFQVGDAANAAFFAEQMEELHKEEEMRCHQGNADMTLARSLVEQYPKEYVFDLDAALDMSTKLYRDMLDGRPPPPPTSYSQPPSHSANSSKNISHFVVDDEDDNDSDDDDDDDDSDDDDDGGGGGGGGVGARTGVGAGYPHSGPPHVTVARSADSMLDWHNEFGFPDLHGTGDTDDESYTPMRQDDYQRLLESTNDAAVEATRNYHSYVPPQDLRVDLYPHQKAAVIWMGHQEAGPVRGGVLADDMGLGKTVTVIAHMLARPVPAAAAASSAAILAASEARLHIPQRNLIIAPAAVVRQWCREIDDKTSRGELQNALLYHGPMRANYSQSDLEYMDVVVASYDVVRFDFRKSSVRRTGEGRTRPHWEFLPSNAVPLFKTEWHRVVLDEAHYIRNHASQSHEAVAHLKAKYRWCLTGTPINNSLADFQSLLHYLRAEPFCNRSKWNAHMKLRGVHFEGVITSRFRAISSTVMLRRRKDTLIDGQPLVTLPSKHFEVVVGEFRDEQERDFYKKVEERALVAFNRFVRRGTVLSNMVHVLALLLRMRRACDHPELVSGKSTTDDDLLRSVRDGAGSAASAHVDPEADLEAFLRGNVYSVSDAAVEQVRRVTTPDCSICLDLMVEPLLCSCCHSFCFACILSVIQSRGGAHSSFPCPLCRALLETREVQLLSRVVPLAAIGIHPPNDEDEGSKEEEEVVVEEEEEVVEAAMKSLLQSTKTAMLLERIQRMRMVDPTAKGVVVSQWTGMLDIVRDILLENDIPCLMYTGSLSMGARDKVLERFRYEDEEPILLLSLKAGGTGLNLTMANYMWILDPWYNPQIINQAVDRVHRIGQLRPVYVERFIIQGTVEERILHLEQSKEAISNAALGEGSVVPQSNRLSLSDLLHLFNVGSSSQP